MDVRLKAAGAVVALVSVALVVFLILQQLPGWVAPVVLLVSMLYLCYDLALTHFKFKRDMAEIDQRHKERMQQINSK